MPTVKETLFKLHLEQFTGRVMLRKDAVEKTIYYRRGNPIYVESSIRSETLGQMLLERQMISEDQYRILLEKMQTEKRLQGDLLVELGYLSSFQVFEALKEQAIRKIENSFLLEEASISVEGGESLLQNVPELPIDFFRLFVESFYGSDLDALMQQIPAGQTMGTNPVAKKYLSDKALNAGESKLVRFLDGKHTVEQALEEAGGDTDAAIALLCALQAVHFLDGMPLTSRAAPAPKAAPAERVKPQSTPEPETPKPRKVVQIVPDAPPKSPVYALALRLDRPFHELLRIDPHTSRIQLQRSYDLIIKELKLDAIEDNYEMGDRKVAESVYERLTLAVTYLLDDKRRQQYAKDLAAKTLTTPIPDPAILAEVCIQKAKLHLSKKRMDAAEAEIKKAIETAPKEAAYHVELADFLLQKSIAEKKDIPQAVEDELKRALTLNSSDERIFFQMGVFCKIKGDFERARNMFQKTVELRPNHSQASAELRVLNRRLDGKRKGESAILSLFKKK